MTILVHRKKGGDRYACERCKCEIGYGSDPTQLLLRPEAPNRDSEKPGETRHPVEAGEPAVDFDPDCPCNCHDTWRTAFNPAFSVPDYRGIARWW